MGQTSSTPSSSPSSSTQRNGRRNTSASSPKPSSSSQHPIHNTTAPDSSSLPLRQPSSPQQLQQQPSSSSPSRVLRSTTERRRRTNLFSSFYPLLSRSSSTPNTNAAGSSSSQSQPNASVVNGTTNVATAANNTNNNAGSSSGSSSRPTRTEWPASRSSSAGPVSRSRSPGLQPLGPTSNSRTPRGLSRVHQRMYDEQSVRSTHSSRASSIVAAHPSAPAYVNPAALPNSVEYMDVDVESTDVAPQPHPSAAQGHGVPGSPPAITHESQLENAGQPDHAMAAQRSTTFSALGSGITRMAQDPASDSVSLYTGLSNPRGGTSISSSLLPIRPDSDDDDDMEHEATSDHGFTVAQADAQTHGRSRLRPRRNVDPAMVAGLIHDQIVQSLREAADVAPSTDRAPAEPVQTVQSSQEQQAMHSHTNAQAPNNSDINTGSSSAMNAHTDSPVERVHVTLHRRRPRSASMRGLLGFQPTDELAADEQPAPQTSNPESTADPSTSPSTESDERPPNAAMDRSQFLLSQLPFFIRLIADLSRSMRPLNGEEELPADSSSETSTTLPSESGASDTNATIGSETDTPLTSASPSPEPGTERPARRHTTIRLIQIGGVPGARNRTRSGAAAANGDEGTQGERGEGQEVRTGEDIAEAVIMFFPGPPEDNHADTETGDSPDGTDQARPRNRNASQWVVLTLSGAASASSSYDDLWALANLIGPARPVTTTQEAIDNAGFPVGKFEHEVQGMRDITTLGDCSKCLVCMSEYEEGENMRALKCKHGFHQECIDKWLTTGANKCPICRAAAVVTESETTTPGIDAIPAALNEE